MTTIHVLSPGFTTPNGRAFLFPLKVWRKALRRRGYTIKIFNRAHAALTACDVLLVDSKFHRDRWLHDTPGIVAEFSAWADQCRVVYCDTTDSSGWLQTELLPVVHVYAKAQLLRDRDRYRAPMYGHRPFTDYYHRKYGVVDAQPEWSLAVHDPAHLGKLRVSWHSGLADYSLMGPMRMALHGRVPLRGLLHFPQRFRKPDTYRPRDLSCRFGASYPRASVSFQRKMIRERMAGRMDTAKVSRRRYFEELATSKAVISPFGYGEITLKDFEVFFTGGILIKPDMTHIETWPDLFRGGETMLAHDWDLSDFETVVDRAISDYKSNIEIARAGQNLYRRHMISEEADDLFCDQFTTLLQ
jgi:hypothetical protein